MATCKYCDDEIMWKYAFGKTPEGKKNIPLNMDGTLHDCRNRAKNDPSAESSNGSSPTSAGSSSGSATAMPPSFIESMDTCLQVLNRIATNQEAEMDILIQIREFLKKGAK